MSHEIRIRRSTLQTFYASDRYNCLVFPFEWYVAAFDCELARYNLLVKCGLPAPQDDDDVLQAVRAFVLSVLKECPTYYHLFIELHKDLIKASVVL